MDPGFNGDKADPRGYLLTLWEESSFVSGGHGPGSSAFKYSGGQCAPPAAVKLHG